ncbi:MAG: hypothetical protein Q7R76_06720 [Candidatus Woesearchaeota archaeon]|nr:hypothetical protein [Candidatus Woesearchaeota archaeon]
MEEQWIQDKLNMIDRKEVPIGYSNHLLYERLSDIQEIDLFDVVVREGSIVPHRSNAKLSRICFKKYFKEYNKTYFVITDIKPNILRIITRFWKHGNA